MRHLLIPFIALLEHMSFADFQEAMLTQAAQAPVDQVNWAAYPYRPACTAYVARSETCLAILFDVSGLDLRAVAMEDNGRSWEDSCCEFFVADPADGSYYNFELTCIGSLLATKHVSRHDSRPRTPDELARILRHSSLPHQPFDISDEVCSWRVAMLIPFDLIGIGGELPETLRANFYKCGDKTAHPHFLSWNPIGTERPDFHRPEYFGELDLR